MAQQEAAPSEPEEDTPDEEQPDEEQEKEEQDMTTAFTGLRRANQRDYPEETVREALLNSIIHRDYPFSGSTIINMFDDHKGTLRVGTVNPAKEWQSDGLFAGEKRTETAESDDKPGDMTESDRQRRNEESQIRDNWTERKRRTRAVKNRNKRRRDCVALVMAMVLGLSCITGHVTAFADEDGVLKTKRSVSIFVATDRHAKYETVTVENEPKEESGAQENSGTEKSKKQQRKKRPVYDANGGLIWHNNLTDVLSLVVQDESAVQPDIVLLGGDNVGDGGNGTRDETGYPMGAPMFSMKAVDAQISYVFGETARGYYTYGSHDTNETGKYEDAFFSGPIEGDDYWIYGISYAQMIYESDWQVMTADEKGKIYNGKDLTDSNGISAQMASHRFLSWVKSLDDHRPILVMSHVPLHADRGDNSGAWIWTRTLNEAAEDHDIIFLWGHNHTLESDEDVKQTEQENYLLLPGANIIVQSWDVDGEGRITTKREIPVPEEEQKGAQSETTEEEAQDSAEEETEPEYELITEQEKLAFVYLNAGYIINGTGSLLTFTDDESDGLWDSLTVKRYLLDGSLSDPVYDMGSDGLLTIPLRDWNEQEGISDSNDLVDVTEEEKPAA